MKTKVDLTKLSDKEIKKFSSTRDLTNQLNMHIKMTKSVFAKWFVSYFSYLFMYRYKQLSFQTLKLSLTLFCIIAPIWYFMTHPNTIFIKGENKVEFVYENDSTRTQEYFLKKIAFYESGGSYNPKGNESYHGKYQIGRAALDAIGFNGISKDDFINDHELQEVAMRRLMKHNKKMMAEWIGKYEGKTIAGIYVTQSGILAASHLGGPGNVMKFLQTNGSEIFRDGNGTPITKYLKELSGYKLSF